MQMKPLPDRIRPLEGAGLVNMASDMRAPLYDLPIEHKRAWKWQAACALFAVVVMVGLAWELVK